MKPAGLTKRQRDALAFIRQSSVKRGYAPSYDEIAEALGIKSKSNVHVLVTGLVERGHLVRVPNAKRSLAVVGGDK